MRRLAWAALVLAACVRPAAAQPPTELPPALPTATGWAAPPSPAAPPPPATEPPLAAPALADTGGGCASCGAGLLGGLKPPDLGDAVAPGCGCGEGKTCVPGRQPCYSCGPKETVAGRFLCGLYDCICCPDPCYEGRWIPLADSAFTVDGVRPVIQQRFRFESGQNVRFPDRSEFFWARADGKGKGPKPRTGLLGELRLRYNDFKVYTEGGTGTASVITEMSYREMQPEVAAHAGGFTDMMVGTKTLLFDCELIQLAFEFKTFLPTGNFTKGLGVGHVSLEPSLLLGLKLTHSTYFQAQVSEWIPLGGDPAAAGSILHYHFSFNQVLCRLLPDVPLIGTLELNGWSFQDGLYTDPILGLQKSSGTTYFMVGNGLRLFVCDKIDIGFGAFFATSEQHLARELYQVDFRVRF
jgi:hypothetical protein